jgi:putative methyltransferase (TIGR04325 family)
VNKVKNALLKVKSGEAAYERDSVVFDRIQYEWIQNVLNFLNIVAKQNNATLHVLDFGGSLGSTYFAVQPFLKNLREFKWSIVEQPKFVEIGQEYFKDDYLNFYNDIESCVLQEHPNVILLSGVLQYLEHPYHLIETILNLNIEYIIIDRTPFVRGEERLTVQVTPPEIYDKSYPAWFLNEQKLLTHLAGKYERIAEFSSLDKAENIPCEYKGLVFKLLPQALNSTNSHKTSEASP